MAGAGSDVPTWPQQHPSVVPTLHDVALHVGRLYTLDFGVRVPLVSKRMYGDSDLLSTVVNAPCSPPVLSKAIRSLSVYGTHNWAKRAATDAGASADDPRLARIRALVNAATTQTRARVHNGKTAFALAIEGCRPDIVTMLLPLPGVDPLQTWEVQGQEDGEEPATRDAYSRACEIAITSNRYSEQAAFALVCARALFPHFTPHRIIGGDNLLTWAAKAGLYENVAAWLPRCSAQLVNALTADGDTVFSIVCAQAKQYTEAGEDASGAAECARLLAESGKVDPGQQDDMGRAPVMWASMDVLPDVLSLLVAHPACPDDVVHRLDNVGRTALHHLVYTEEGKPRVVTEICSWRSYEDNETVISAHECARLLADKGALDAADAPDVDGNGPHHLVCIGGFSELLSRLLADPAYSDRWDERNDAGHTPFSAACCTTMAIEDLEEVSLEQPYPGPAACALMLAKRGLVVPGTVANEGGTHVMWAAAAGLPDVLKLLLEDPRCTPQVVLAVDQEGQTPLYLVCKHMAPADSLSCTRYQACARLLAAKGALSANSPAPEGMNPAHLVCYAGLPDLLELIVADPAWTPALLTAQEYKARDTPFTIVCRWAVDDSHGGLSSRVERVYPERDYHDAEDYRQTAVDCMKHLMRVDGALSPASRGFGGGSHVLWAAKAALPDVLQKLLDVPDFEPELVVRPNDAGETPLSCAVDCLCDCPTADTLEGLERCIRILAGRGALSPLTRRVRGMTPAHLIAKAGLPDLMAQLLADPAYTDHVLKLQEQEHGLAVFPFACTQCHYVYADGGTECAILLAQSGRVDPGGVDKDGKSNLWYAVQEGLAEAVEALMRHLSFHSVSLAEVNSQNETLLYWCCTGGRVDMDGMEGLEDMRVSSKGDRASCARLLASKDTLAANSPAPFGLSPAHLVCLVGLPDLLEHMVSHPAWTPEVLAKPCDSEKGAMSPFALACAGPKGAARQDSEKCAVLLIQRGAVDPAHQCGVGGHSHLGWAVRAGFPAAVQVLLQDERCTADVCLGALGSDADPKYRSALLSSTVILTGPPPLDSDEDTESNWERYWQCVRYRPEQRAGCLACAKLVLSALFSKGVVVAESDPWWSLCKDVMEEMEVDAGRAGAGAGAGSGGAVVPVGGTRGARGGARGRRGSRGTATGRGRG